MCALRPCFRSLCGLSAVLRLTAENFPDGFDQTVFLDGDLRRTALAPGHIVLDLGGKTLAFGELLDLHFPGFALLRPLNDLAWRIATLGIFHLRLHAGPADIHFRADTLLAQIRGHLLVA